MIYFSELLHKPVYTEDKVYVGKLRDLIFLAVNQPIVSKLVIENKEGQKLIVSMMFFKKHGDEITIQKNYEIAELEINELFVLKNLLDKQIIDIKGSKVVRVNDVAIQEKPNWYIAGVDIGFYGILRWFKLENIVRNLLGRINVRRAPRFLSWGDIQPIELARGKVQLKKEEEKLQKMRPEDLADYLEQTNIVNAQRILRLLDDEFAADVIRNLNLSYQQAVFRHFSTEKAAEVLNLIDSDEAVDILLSLGQKRRNDIIQRLEPERKKEITYLLSLSTTPIGELINPEFLAVQATDTVSMVLSKVKKETADFSWVNYVYVLNKEDQLTGVFNLRELIMQDSETPVYRFMNQNVIVAHLTTPKEIAIKRLLKYRVQALPVIDQGKHILGVVLLNDAAQSIAEKIRS